MQMSDNRKPKTKLKKSMMEDMLFQRYYLFHF
jgi:hypothetical protein